MPHRFRGSVASRSERSVSIARPRRYLRTTHRVSFGGGLATPRVRLPGPFAFAPERSGILRHAPTDLENRLSAPMPRAHVGRRGPPRRSRP
jgi:hypothetical protein